MKIYVLVDSFYSYDHGGSDIISLHTTRSELLQRIQKDYPTAIRKDTAFGEYWDYEISPSDEYKRSLNIEIHELEDSEVSTKS